MAHEPDVRVRRVYDPPQADDGQRAPQTTAQLAWLRTRMMAAAPQTLLVAR